MKKFLFILCLIPFFVAAKTAPKCDDDKVIQEVERKSKEIIIDSANKKIALSDDVIKAVNFSVSEIINKGLVKETGAYVCQAQLSMIVDDTIIQTNPILYSVELASKSRLGFFVNVVSAED